MDTFNQTPDLPSLDHSEPIQSFYQHHSPGTWMITPPSQPVDLSDSQKDFLKYESQRQ